jgi:methyltransferase-like protein/SAM-dependent methyltransferase
MPTPSDAANPYDEVPYPSDPLTNSDPDRMAAVASLFGMQPPPADRCRVLEIGCSTGGNLIPLADRHPRSSFVGIDYSQVQIASAQRAIQTLGLDNIEFRQADIADLGDELGNFDYIIVHGVYSWVRPELAERILALCGSLLSEQGIGFVSYNALPGWHHRAIIREILWRYAPPGGPNSQRLARARAVLDFFSATLDVQPEPNSKLLKHMIDVVLRQPDHYIWHEYFAEESHPLYFYQFAERLPRFGLQYLGEAALHTMFASSFGLEVDEQVNAISRDVISVEQHVDMLRNRAFRQSLVCRRQVRLNRQLAPDCLKNLYIAGRLRPRNPQLDLNSAAAESFLRPDGRAVSSPSPPFKAALAYLGSVWPRAVSFDELAAGAARLRSGADATLAMTHDERQNLGHNLVQCLANGIVEATSLPDDFVTTASSLPCATRLARIQARSSKVVTNRRHQQVPLDESTRHVVQILDGKHDRPALLASLVSAVDRGELSILVEGVPATAGRDVSHALSQSLDKSLAYLAYHALLTA